MENIGRKNIEEKTHITEREKHSEKVEKYWIKKKKLTSLRGRNASCKQFLQAAMGTAARIRLVPM